MKIMKNKYVKYLTVLDFEVGRVFRYKLEKPLIDEEDGFCPYEEFINDKGHWVSNCQWMVHDIAQVITAEDYREVVINNK